MIQNGQYDDKKFQCEEYPQHSMKLICFSEQCPYKRRFICIQCILDLWKDQQGVVTIQDFIANPLKFLDKKNEFDQFKNKNNDFDLILQKFVVLETNLIKCHQDVLEKIKNIKLEIQKLIVIYQQNVNNLEKTLKIKEFQQQLHLVWNMDTHQGTNEFEQLEQQLNLLVINWKDNCNNLKNEVFNSQNKIFKDVIIIQQQVDDDIKQGQIIFDNMKQSIPQIPNNIEYFIHNEISKGRLLRYELLYSGIRDGLTLESDQQKIDKQQQLLTIISLKNGNVVGAYTPCQLNYSLNTWIVDNSNLSFIFQQNKKEIYKLKNNTYTVYCNKQYGPWYGYNGQIGISSNFNNLTSNNFGETYDITGYKVENKQTHLIGEKDTQVSECKVYKIIFL